MKILFDLQSVQEDGLESHHSKVSLTFLHELLSGIVGHEICVVLTDLYPETIDPLRLYLEGIISVDKIFLWHCPLNVEQSRRIEIAWHIRENYIAALRPDFIYIAGNPKTHSFQDAHTTKSRLLVSIPFSIERLESESTSSNAELNPSVVIDLKVSLNGSAKDFTINVISTIEASLSAKRISFSETGAGERLTLACVSPLPPEPSGISSYTAELLPYLLRYYTIDVIVDQDHVADGFSANGIAVRSVSWFRDNYRRYDRVLYHFGNSPFHKHMFALLEEIPGAVVLHDFFLSGIVGYMEDNSLNKGYLPRELYNAHGYYALSEWLRGVKSGHLVQKYPCSFQVFDNADGVIVHSRHAWNLAMKWYGPQIKDHLRIIPHLRVLKSDIDRQKARRTLGVGADEFIVCTFGHVNQNKMGLDLLDAWNSSSLSLDTACILVYVGENDSGSYGQKLHEAIFSSRNVRLTGWVNDDRYNCWLQAADVAVQLRQNSRGESSGAVLDCLSHGLPVVVNAHGSMAEFPEDSVVMISDNCSREEIVDALEMIRNDADLRHLTGDRARKYIRNNHVPEDVAIAYMESIEAFHAGMYSRCRDVIDTVMNNECITNGDICLKALASSLAESFPSPARQKQLLIDVSALVETDLKTGIQRVVRSIVKNLIDLPSPGFRVEPVYATSDQDYRYARRSTIEWLGCGSTSLFDDEYIDIHKGDILFIPDLHFGVVERHKSTYQHIRHKGGQVIFLVHDLLPLFMPHYFPEGTKSSFEAYLDVISASADAVIGVTQTVARDIEQWVREDKSHRHRPLYIGWNHHGADIDASMPSKGYPEGFERELNMLCHRPTILMVGTVEPRKGHRQALSAFELLWKNGNEINLVIVGKHGWMVDELADALKRHPEMGYRLFWYQGISDEALLQLYQFADGVLMASEGEGFGLPLIEAAQHGKPILARDIPVFREIGGNNASYFSGFNPESLADAVRDWVIKQRKGNAPQSTLLPWLTWSESTQRLLAMINDRDHLQWITSWSNR
jgi:glycosyltransferase involved in cell wall biosynthesis